MTESGRMQWNLGGWLGAQLGATAWMLIAGVLSLRIDLATGLLVLGIFLVANLIGIAIWRSRDSLSAYAGIQILLPVVGVGGLAAVFVLDRAGIFEAIQIGARTSAKATYLIIVLVVAALMLMFYLIAGRKPKGIDEL